MVNRIVKMGENRRTKEVFLWDKQLNDSNQITSWSSEIKCIFSDCNMLDIYGNCNPFNMKSTTTEMQQIFKIKQQNYLKDECEIKPKLSLHSKTTYICTKTIYWKNSAGVPPNTAGNRAFFSSSFRRSP